MIEDIKKTKDDYNNFIIDCLHQLKSSRVCYVYKKEQIEEIIKRFKGEVTIEDNACGYTIRVKRERSKKNE